MITYKIKLLNVPANWDNPSAGKRVYFKKTESDELYKEWSYCIRYLHHYLNSVAMPDLQLHPAKKSSRNRR